MAEKKESEYLAWFGHDNDFFRFAVDELVSCGELAASGLKMPWLYLASQQQDREFVPYAEYTASREVASRIATRTVLSKFHIEVAYKSISEVHRADPACLEVISDVVQSRRNTDRPVHVINVVYGKRPETHRPVIDCVALADGGKLWLAKDVADADLCIIEVLEHNPNLDEPLTSVRRVFVGIPLVGDRSRSSLKLVAQQSLKQRRVLGPTTLESALAHTMCNIALVRNGSLVYDPFCGTGSVLIAASSLGAMCLGSDIDARVLRGASVSRLNPYATGNTVNGTFSADDNDTSVFANFRHYRLPRPEILVSCAHSSPISSMSSSRKLFDAIVTDVPYGCRAGARRVGSKNKARRVDRPAHCVMSRDNHFAQRVEYSELWEDLFLLASTSLVVGGRLVFLAQFDMATELFTPDEIVELSTFTSGTRFVNGRIYTTEDSKSPQFCDPHIFLPRIKACLEPIPENLKLISACIQVLAAGKARVLVSMQRV